LVDSELVKEREEAIAEKADAEIFRDGGGAARTRASGSVIESFEKQGGREEDTPSIMGVEEAAAAGPEILRGRMEVESPVPQ